MPLSHALPIETSMELEQESTCYPKHATLTGRKRLKNFRPQIREPKLDQINAFMPYPKFLLQHITGCAPRLPHRRNAGSMVLVVFVAQGQKRWVGSILKAQLTSKIGIKRALCHYKRRYEASHYPKSRRGTSLRRSNSREEIRNAHPGFWQIVISVEEVIFMNA